MRLPNVDPANMRCGTIVLWKYIDPWLSRCQRQGDLAQLAAVLEIHIGTLRRRRRKLGMRPLPPGRPKVKALTPTQSNVVNSLKKGKTVSQIAAETGVTPQSVSSAKTKAEAKAAPDRRACKHCDQRGIVDCRSCRGIGPHFHMCPECLGDGFLGAV